MTDDILEGEVLSDESTFLPDLAHIPFCGIRSGWCMEGRHHRCPVVFGGNEYPDPSRKGATLKTETKQCPCECHLRDYIVALGAPLPESEHI